MFRMQILPFLKSATSFALMSAAFCGWTLLCVWGIRHYNADLNTTPAQVASIASAASEKESPPIQITNELRYTTMGWQTPSHWARQRTQSSQLSIDQLHPVLVAVIMLLLSLLAIVLDASDRDVERLLKISEE